MQIPTAKHPKAPLLNSLGYIECPIEEVRKNLVTDETTSQGGIPAGFFPILWCIPDRLGWCCPPPRECPDPTGEDLVATPPCFRSVSRRTSHQRWREKMGIGVLDKDMRIFQFDDPGSRYCMTGEFRIILASPSTTRGGPEDEGGEHSL